MYHIRALYKHRFVPVTLVFILFLGLIFPAAADAGQVIVNPTSLSLIEGGTGTYTLALNSQPTATVTVTVNADAQTQVGKTSASFGSTRSYIFTTFNWNQTQTVYVRPVDDTVDEGAHAAVIMHSVTSADPNFNTISVPSVNVSITDNEGLSICESATGVPQVECEALVMFYWAANGPNWIDHTNWLTHILPCSWKGVTCTAGHVTSISLADNHLTGSLPPEVGNLENLQIFNLLRNQVSGEIPSEITNLHNLRTLDFSFNALDGPLPSGLEGLYSLIEFDLSDNQLTGAIPIELMNVTTLKTLDLSNNWFDGEIPSSISNLDGIETLHLFLNSLSGEIPAGLWTLETLKELNLSGNKLSGDVPLAITNLVNLQELNLRLNMLTFTDPIVREFWSLQYTQQTVTPVIWSVSPVYLSGKPPALLVLHKPDSNLVQEEGVYAEIGYSTNPDGPFTVVQMEHEPFNFFGLTMGTTYYFQSRIGYLPHYQNKNHIITDWSNVGSATFGDPAPRILINIPGNSLEVVEGGDVRSYTVGINTAPSIPVTIEVEDDWDDEGIRLSTDGVNFVVRKVTLAFTPENWDQPQTIYVKMLANNRPNEGVRSNFTINRVLSLDDPIINGYLIAPIRANMKIYETTADFVELITPADLGEVDTPYPLLRWKPYLRADSFRVRVRDSFGDSILNTTFTPGAVCTNAVCKVDFAALGIRLDAGETYDWRVQAQGDFGTVNSLTRIFTVNYLVPGFFTLESPSDEEVVNTPWPAFVWTEATNTTNYRLQIRDDFGSTILNFKVAAGTTPSIADICTDGVCQLDLATTGIELEHNEAYDWRILAQNAVAKRASPRHGFTVVLPVPESFMLLSPAKNGATDTLTPTFTWQESTNATVYRLRVYDLDNGKVVLKADLNPEQANCVDDTCEVDSSTLTYKKALEDGELYRWRVVAVNDFGVRQTIYWRFTASITTAPLISGGRLSD